MSKQAVAGNAGPKIRSDCEVTLGIRRSGGIKIDIRSRVRPLYGKSIEALCRDILTFYSIRNADLILNDSGALPFVISARIEAAIQMVTGSRLEFIPGMLPRNKYKTERDKFRFTRLYLPGNTPGLMINAGLHSPDGIILDLEDSVAPDKKGEARILVRNALRQIDFYGAERMVRINQGEKGLEDLSFVIPHYVNMVLLPKCESAEEVKMVENRISSIRAEKRLKNPVWLMPVIESALGVEKAMEIATASPDVVAVAIGLEDYTADMGVQRTMEGKESLYARTRLVNAAKAAGIQPIDSVFSDVADMMGLELNVAVSKALGFEGMGCIHPRQIDVIKRGFLPAEEEIERAKKIVIAYGEAMASGLGVVSLGSKMIDPPVVKRALRIIDISVRMGILNSDWISGSE
jgi:citrate lyase subunit beta / citryl-CoA lyase